VHRTDAAAADDRGDIGRPQETDLMALTLRRRSRRDSTPTPADGIARAEHAAMTRLAGTLRELAAGLPSESKLAGEYARIARAIDVAGVLGTWRLDAMTRELAEYAS
jgi:hypothetical protein